MTACPALHFCSLVGQSEVLLDAALHFPPALAALQLSPFGLALASPREVAGVAPLVQKGRPAGRSCEDTEPRCHFLHLVFYSLHFEEAVAVLIFGRFYGAIDEDGALLGEGDDLEDALPLLPWLLSHHYAIITLKAGQHTSQSFLLDGSSCRSRFAVRSTPRGIHSINPPLIEVDEEDNIYINVKVPSLKYMSLRRVGIATMKAKRSSSSVLMKRQMSPLQLRCSTLLRRQLMQSWGVIMMKPKMAMKATAVSSRKEQQSFTTYAFECRAHHRQTTISGTSMQFMYHTAYESIFSLFRQTQLVSSLTHGKSLLTLMVKVRDIFQTVTAISSSEKPMIILLELCWQTQSVRMIENTSSQKRVLRDTPLLFYISFQKRYSCRRVKNRRMVWDSDRMKKAATRQTWLVKRISLSSSMAASSIRLDCTSAPIGPRCSNMRQGWASEQKAEYLMTSQGKMWREKVCVSLARERGRQDLKGMCSWLRSMPVVQSCLPLSALERRLIPVFGGMDWDWWKGASQNITMRLKSTATCRPYSAASSSLGQDGTISSIGSYEPTVPSCSTFLIF